jgi:hypothetical protein
MIRFRALEKYIHESMTDLELGVILDSPHIGTLALLSRFFDPEIPSNDSGTGKEHEAEGTGERVKMNQWCWIFLGAWTVGEAGRTLKAHQAQPLRRGCELSRKRLENGDVDGTKDKVE